MISGGRTVTSMSEYRRLQTLRNTSYQMQNANQSMLLRPLGTLKDNTVIAGMTGRDWINLGREARSFRRTVDGVRWTIDAIAGPVRRINEETGSPSGRRPVVAVVSAGANAWTAVLAALSHFWVHTAVVPPFGGETMEGAKASASALATALADMRRRQKWSVRVLVVCFHGYADKAYAHWNEVFALDRYVILYANLDVPTVVNKVADPSPTDPPYAMGWEVSPISLRTGHVLRSPYLEEGRHLSDPMTAFLTLATLDLRVNPWMPSVEVVKPPAAPKFSPPPPRPKQRTTASTTTSQPPAADIPVLVQNLFSLVGKFDDFDDFSESYDKQRRIDHLLGANDPAAQIAVIGKALLWVHADRDTCVKEYGYNEEQCNKMTRRGDVLLYKARDPRQTISSETPEIHSQWVRLKKKGITATIPFLVVIFCLLFCAHHPRKQTSKR